MEAGQLDSVIRVAEAIDKYGAPTLGFAVLLVICMVVVLVIMRRYQKLAKGKDTDFQKLFSDMQSQNTELFQRVVQQAFKGSQQEIVPESITTTGVVRGQLKNAAAVTKADRISVYAFHNGQRMTTGRHMVKVSCWAEYAMLAKFVSIGNHKDIQIAKLQDICEILMEHGRWEALTEEEVNRTQLSTWEEGEDNLKSAFAQAIHSTDGILIGFVLMEYLLAPIEKTWIEKAREECKKLSDKVSIVLDIEYK